MNTRALAADIDDADILAGSTEQFAILYDRHAATLHRYCTRRVGLDAADDIVSSTFLVAYEQRKGFVAEHSSALPWLYGIATNLLRRRYRDEVRALRAYSKTGLDPLNHPTTDTTDETAARMDALTLGPALALALSELSRRHRDVLSLAIWSGLSHSEIATALGIELGTVRSRLFRAKEKLRTTLERNFPGYQFI